MGSNPHFANSTGEWHDLPRHYAKMPLVTARLGPEIPSDQHYGLQLDTSVKGRHDRVSFTVHCFASACKESGEESTKYAHDLADDIKDYLETNRFKQSIHAIKDITDLTLRESMPAGVPANIRRVILEGVFEIEEQHSY